MSLLDIILYYNNNIKKNSILFKYKFNKQFKKKVTIVYVHI